MNKKILMTLGSLIIFCSVSFAQYKSYLQHTYVKNWNYLELQLINCNVKTISSFHNGSTNIIFKDGTTLSTYEPKDEYKNLVPLILQAKERCGEEISFIME